jgi:hypothetical protein
VKVITRPTVFFDVDDTLVMWNQSPTHPNAVEMKVFGFVENLVPHEGHIKQMKDHAFRGHHVVVWSAGGWEWAQAVVIALGLEQYVDEVMDKPHWFYDDLRSDQFMPESLRIYIETYKSRNKGHGEADSHVPGVSYAVADADIKEGGPIVVQNGRAYPV